MIIVGSEFRDQSYQQLLEKKHEFFTSEATSFDVGQELEKVVLVLLVVDSLDNMFGKLSMTNRQLTYSVDYLPGQDASVAKPVMRSAQVSYKDYLYVFMDYENGNEVTDEYLEELRPYLVDVTTSIYSLEGKQTTLANSTNIPKGMGLTKPMNGEVDRLVLEVDSLSAELNKVIRSIYRKQRELTAKRNELAVAEAAGANCNITVEHPLVDSWSVIKNILWISTKKLDCHSPEVDETVPLGRMVVNVNLGELNSGSQAAIRVFNLDRVERGWSDKLLPHPHVVYNEEEGVSTGPCLGNYMDSVVNSIVNGEYELLVEYIIRFLTSANAEDDAGRWMMAFKNDVSFSNQQLSKVSINEANEPEQQPEGSGGSNQSEEGSN